VNPVSMGHITSSDSPQNGHTTACGTSFILLCGPETLNVFLHFVQVTIFSTVNSRAVLSRMPERLLRALSLSWFWLLLLVGLLSGLVLYALFLIVFR
jgi:hypothetical protein